MNLLIWFALFAFVLFWAMVWCTLVEHYGLPIPWEA